MTTVADVVDAVVGGDTHADTHTLQIALPSSAAIATETFPNTPAGFAAAIGWIVEYAPGPRVVVGLEGTRSYGIALERALAGAGFPVVEVERPNKTDRRGRGKSDEIDARHAVLKVLAMDPDRLPTPRADGDREALRILLVARRDLNLSKTADSNRLTALLRGGDDDDRALVGSWTRSRLEQITRRRSLPRHTREQTIRRAEARRLATAVLAAETELTRNSNQLQTIVSDLASDLTDRIGIGPVSAAQALVSYSHPGRIHSEAAFAALGGASPLKASTGKTKRHRLNRGGDRQLNRGPARHRQDPHALGPTHHRLRRPTHRRGTVQTRDHPLSQALPRPRALPPAA